MLPANTASFDSGLGGGKKPSSRSYSTMREIVAAAFWLYAVVNTLILNIDTLILKVMPAEYAWLLDFKFLAFLGGCALILITLDRVSAAKFLAWVLFYPLIVLLWRIPQALLRAGSWPLALGLLNAAVSFFYEFRYRLISIFVYLFSFTAIAVSNYPPILLAASIALFVVTGTTYYRAIKSIFSPNVLFRIYSSVFSSKREIIQKSFALDDDIRDIPVPVMTSDQLKKWSDKLGYAVLFNRVCLFAAQKLQLFHGSGFALASGALSVIFLVVLTTLTFAAMNFALYKTAPATFEITTQPSLFTFVFYSFNALVNNFIKEVTPIAWSSYLIWMTEAMCAIGILVLFAAHFVALKTEKYAEQLAVTAKALEAEGKIVETHLSAEWKLASIDDAMRELDRLKSDMLALSLWLTKYIK